MVPCTREATLVHFVDNLGGNSAASTGSSARSPTAQAGPDFDRGISASAFFATREQARREEAA